MKAEEHGRRIGGNEPANQVGEWVIVMRREREWRSERVVPGLMILGKEGRARVQGIAMQNISQDLTDR